jgi:hypothetical protein
MQTRHLVDDAAEGRISRRLVAGDGLELLDRIPLDLDRDPLLGTVLGDGLIDALADALDQAPLIQLRLLLAKHSFAGSRCRM